MIRSPRPRKTVTVSNAFHRQLTLYALSARPLHSNVTDHSKFDCSRNIRDYA
jgi:hypothetical protein